MRLIQCEFCGRGFVPDDEAAHMPIISGRSVAEVKAEEEVSCPYCGKKQNKQTLAYAL